jgi:hypothetical protein
MFYVGCPNWGQFLNPQEGGVYLYPLCPDIPPSTHNNGTLVEMKSMHGGPGYAQPLTLTQSYEYDGHGNACLTAIDQSDGMPFSGVGYTAGSRVPVAFGAGYNSLLWKGKCQ